MRDERPAAGPSASVPGTSTELVLPLVAIGAFAIGTEGFMLRIHRLQHSDAAAREPRISSRGGRNGSMWFARRGAGAAMALVASLLVLAPVRGRATESIVSERTGGHLTTRSSLRDLLNRPAFAGHGDLLLPWDSRDYDENMPLTDIGSLLPFHSHVEPETVTSALNRMIDDVSGGRTVFYRFYTEAQWREQPARELTGLFFFRGRPGAVCRDLSGRRVLSKRPEIWRQFE